MVVLRAENNFAQALVFTATLRNYRGDLKKVEFGHNNPIAIPRGWALVEIQFPDLARGGWVPPRTASLLSEDRAEVASIRNALAFGSAVMEDTESMAATVAQALRKFNEMILLFRDFSFYSTTDKVYLRMDGKDYEITISEPRLT